MFFSSSTIRMVAIAEDSAPRQLEREAAALADLALQVDAAAVRLHDVAHDGEPEAGRAELAAVGTLHEALEDALPLVRRDAGPRVADGHPHRPVLRRRLDPDTPAAGRVAQRVRDQVGERPGDLGRITRDRHAAGGGGGLEGDAALARLEGEEPGDPRDHLAQVHVLAFERDAGGAPA